MWSRGAAQLGAPFCEAGGCPARPWAVLVAGIQEGGLHRADLREEASMWQEGSLCWALALGTQAVTWPSKQPRLWPVSQPGPEL